MTVNSIHLNNVHIVSCMTVISVSVEMIHKPNPGCLWIIQLNNNLYAGECIRSLILIGLRICLDRSLIVSIVLFSEVDFILLQVSCTFVN